MQKLKELCNGGGEPGKLSKHPKRKSPKGGSLEAVKKKKNTTLNTKPQKNLY